MGRLLFPRGRLGSDLGLDFLHGARPVFLREGKAGLLEAGEADGFPRDVIGKRRGSDLLREGAFGFRGVAEAAHLAFVFANQGRRGLEIDTPFLFLLGRGGLIGGRGGLPCLGLLDPGVHLRAVARDIGIEEDDEGGENEEAPDERGEEAPGHRGKGSGPWGHDEAAGEAEVDVHRSAPGIGFGSALEEGGGSNGRPRLEGGVGEKEIDGEGQ